MMRRRSNDSPRRRLYRDPERGIVFGVCAGLADTFASPLWLARVTTLALAWYFPESTLVAYVVAAVLLPVQPLRWHGRGDEASFWRSGRNGV